MGQRDLVAVDPVVTHQQPAREPRLDAVMRIGDRAVRALDDGDLDEAEQHRPQGPTGVDRREQPVGGDDLRVPVAHLDEGLVRRAITAEQHGGARHALAPENADFGAPVLRRVRDDGADAAFRKEHAPDRLVRGDERLLALQPHALQMRLEQPQIIVGQRAEQEIGGIGLN